MKKKTTQQTILPTQEKGEWLRKSGRVAPGGPAPAAGQFRHLCTHTHTHR